MAHFLKFPNSFANLPNVVTNTINTAVHLTNYASLKSNIYQRSVFAFEHFEKRRNFELRQFNFEDIKQIFVTQLNNGNIRSKNNKRIGMIPSEKLKKNLDSLVLTSRTNRDLDFVIFTYKK
jgi:hypothetical protein